MDTRKAQLKEYYKQYGDLPSEIFWQIVKYKDQPKSNREIKLQLIQKLKTYLVELRQLRNRLDWLDRRATMNPLWSLIHYNDLSYDKSTLIRHIHSHEKSIAKLKSELSWVYRDYK